MDHSTSQGQVSTARAAGEAEPHLPASPSGAAAAVDSTAAGLGCDGLELSLERRWPRPAAVLAVVTSAVPACVASASASCAQSIPNAPSRHMQRPTRQSPRPEQQCWSVSLCTQPQQPFHSGKRSTPDIPSRRTPPWGRLPGLVPNGGAGCSFGRDEERALPAPLRKSLP
eukprot:scaffold1548_cov50-Phaeocystis_antarctica.AAC.4